MFVLSQTESLDGGKRWKNDKMSSEEKGSVPGFGSPTKAVNLLDTVIKKLTLDLVTSSVLIYNVHKRYKISDKAHH